MLPKEEYTAVTIKMQGAIELEKFHSATALILERSDKLLLLTVDCDSKYGQVVGAVNDPPGVWLAATKRTLKLKEGAKRDDMTLVEFPSLPNWEVVLAAWNGRYSFTACLRRTEDEASSESPPKQQD